MNTIKKETAINNYNYNIQQIIFNQPSIDRYHHDHDKVKQRNAQIKKLRN